jgi:hypothetical protein
MKRYICEQCNTEYEALDKYELVEKVPHADFGMDIEEFEDLATGINIIYACDVCYDEEEMIENTPYDRRDIEG